MSDAAAGLVYGVLVGALVLGIGVATAGWSPGLGLAALAFGLVAFGLTWAFGGWWAPWIALEVLFAWAL